MRSSSILVWDGLDNVGDAPDKLVIAVVAVVTSQPLDSMPARFIRAWSILYVVVVKHKEETLRQATVLLIMIQLLNS